MLLYTQLGDGARAARALRSSLRRGELARSRFLESAERVLTLREAPG